MCKCKNKGCKDFKMQLNQGPPGPQGLKGDPGMDGTNGTNGSDGINGTSLIDMKGTQDPVELSTHQDAPIDYLYVSEGSFEVGDKINVTFLFQFSDIAITSNVTDPEISVAVSLSNLVPPIGGMIFPYFLFIGPSDPIQNGDVVRVQFSFSRIYQNPLNNWNEIVLEGVYQWVENLSTYISANSMKEEKMIFKHNPAFTDMLDQDFYFSLNVGLNETSCKVTLLYASADLMKGQ